MSDRSIRVLRGLAAAAISTFVAAFSHVAAGGGAPGGAGLALALAFSVMLCVGLSVKAANASVALIAVGVVCSQVVFHLLFGVGGANGSGLAVAAVEHHGHALATVVPDAASSTSPHVHDSSAMWFGHAVAALVTIVALRRGEVTLRRLIALAREHVVAPAGRRVVAVLAMAAAGAWASSMPRPARSAARTYGSLPVIDALRDLGVVHGSLRHRGPPRMSPRAVIAPLCLA